MPISLQHTNNSVVQDAHIRSHRGRVEPIHLVTESGCYPHRYVWKLGTLWYLTNIAMVYIVWPYIEIDGLPNLIVHRLHFSRAMIRNIDQMVPLNPSGNPWVLMDLSLLQRSWGYLPSFRQTRLGSSPYRFPSHLKDPCWGLLMYWLCHHYTCVTPNW